MASLPSTPIQSIFPFGKKLPISWLRPLFHVPLDHFLPSDGVQNVTCSVLQVLRSHLGEGQEVRCDLSCHIIQAKGSCKAESCKVPVSSGSLSPEEQAREALCACTGTCRQGSPFFSVIGDFRKDSKKI